MAAGRGLLVVALDAGGDALAVVADLVRPEGAEPAEQHQDSERDEQVAEAPEVVVRLAHERHSLFVMLSECRLSVCFGRSHTETAKCPLAVPVPVKAPCFVLPPLPCSVHSLSEIRKP